ncbi:MAG: ComF family protein [Lentisphaeria bacterium]|nr:ComF family protein [Lentisphaeria bacterium]
MKRFLKKCFGFYNLFPCPVCGTGDGGGENRICPECMEKMPLIPGDHCTGCGGSLDSMLARCSKCLESADFPWQDAFSLFEYRGVARDLIHRMKYYGQAQLARTFGILLAEKLAAEAPEFDLILPLPLFWVRKLERSYNQSELLAKVIGKELSVPVGNDLKRIKGGKHQASLGRRQRQIGARGVFAVKHPEKLYGKRILLVDDVFTTGATLNSAAKVLMKANVKALYVATIARTQRWRDR